MIDILYCAWNRLQFTTATWNWMMSHTNWDLVEQGGRVRRRLRGRHA